LAKELCIDYKSIFGW